MPPTDKILFGHEIPAEYSTSPAQIISGKLYRFRLRLNSPLHLKENVLVHREGLILILTDSEGYCGLSEISPLPGFSLERLESVANQMTAILQKSLGSRDFPESYLQNAGSDELLESSSLADYGMQSAILDLLATKNDLDVGRFLFGESSDIIPINGLINVQLADWIPEAERLVRAGYKTLKIKVGHINSELEAVGIQNIREAVGPDIKLRLDANRVWDLETATNFGRSLETVGIEYIEEPVPNPQDLPRFYDRCGMPFALDETLHHGIGTNVSFHAYTGLKALVLKPTLIASIPRLLALVSDGRKHGIQTVLSSSYESEIGLSYLASLAGAITGSHTASGLDTGTVFGENISGSPSIVENGEIKISKLNCNDLHLDKCELIHES